MAAERGYPLSEVRSRPGGAILHLKSGVLAGRSHPVPEARGGGWEEQPHAQGAVAAWAQGGLQELSHVEGQVGQQ